MNSRVSRNYLRHLASAICVLVIAGFSDAAADDAAYDPTVTDEAAQACPAGVDPDDPKQAWWCGMDPASVVRTVDGKQELTVFQEHPYINVATVPTPDTNDIDWTCIEGECGGILDPDFITGRELSHIWRPANPGDPELRITEEQRSRAVKGRNTWLMWTGGNHAFWDYLARHGYGLADFVKLLDNRYLPRSNRFARLGLINEPGMQAPTRPDRYGLWLDVPKGWEGDAWPPDPGSLPAEVPDPYVYGYSSGVLGFRVFRNPDFFYGEKAQDAQDNWDPDKFLSDVNYSKDPNLIRPYRIGMACGFCHVAFNPINPPADSAEPEWRNIMTNMGSQYFKFGQLAASDFRETNLLWHLVNYAKPGTLDTSLVATDGNNNPSVMNGVFNLVPRIANSYNFSETPPANAQLISTIDLSVLGLDLPPLPEAPQRHTMRVLAGGEDSTGTRLALDRVYLNIGEFHQEWRQTANLLVGIREQRPFRIERAEKASVYWNVSDFRAQNLAEFFAYVSGPKKLADAPGGTDHLLDAGDPRLARGKEVFATHCLVCHSSKQPDGFWADPANWRRWLQDDDYLRDARELVQRDDFLIGNYLSTDVRYSVTDIGVNMARSTNDNSKSGHIWEDFSSDDYKAQAVLEGEVRLAHPYDRDATIPFTFSDRIGPGRMRPLSLVSIWASAPYLHNNSVGQFPAGNDPGNFLAREAADVSVAGRMVVFENSINQLLGIEQRRGFDSMVRTSVDTQIEIQRVVLLDFIDQQLGPVWKYALIGFLIAVAIVGLGLALAGLRRLQQGTPKRVRNVVAAIAGIALVAGVANLWFKEEFRLGHIPAGTPVSLIFNINGPGWIKGSDDPGLIRVIAWDLIKVTVFGLPSLDHERVPDLVDNLLKLNKMPDFVLDRGHTFGDAEVVDAAGNVIMRSMSDAEKRDLIEYLKTL